MHTGDLVELEQTSLTEQEKETLLEVMEKAKEFDRKMSAQNRGTHSLEGQLYKWTNPLKGWQPRWFSVDQQQGVLHYYTSEDKKKQPPRGSLHLWGAVVAPSEEDSQTFTVNGANGEVYKLRGQGAKERQHWVSRLRREVENCNQSYNMGAREAAGATTNGEGQSGSSPHHSQTLITPTKTISKRLTKGWIRQSSRGTLGGKSGGATLSSGTVDTEGAQEEAGGSARGLDNFPGGDAMLEVLTRLQRLQETFSSQLQVCVAHGDLSATDQSVLLSRSTSQAALASVKDCLALMKVNMTSNEDSAHQQKRSSSGSPTHQFANNHLSPGHLEHHDVVSEGSREGSRDVGSSHT